MVSVQFVVGITCSLHKLSSTNTAFGVKLSWDFV